MNSYFEKRKFIYLEIRPSFPFVETADVMRMPDISISGSIVYITRQITVIKIPMIGSSSIPLGILKPNAIDIVAWSFIGFSGRRATDPNCILVLGCRNENAFTNLSSVLVCTHIGDRCVSLKSRSSPLSRVEMSIIAKAVVSALGPAGLAHFDALSPVLGAGLDTLLADSAASDVSIRCGSSVDAWLAHGIDFIPDYLIVRSSAGYACSPITSVRFHAPHRAGMTLTTDVRLDTQSVDGAILCGHGQYASARIIGAM